MHVNIFSNLFNVAHFVAAPRSDTIPTEEEQATGLERREFEAMVAGNMVCLFINEIWFEWLKLLCIKAGKYDWEYLCLSMILE